VHSRLRFLPALLVFVLLGGIRLRAQAPEPTQAELIRQLQKRIDELEASQKSLQEKVEKLSAAAPPGASPETPVPQQQEETVPAETPAPHILGPVQLHGFSDLDYGRAWFEKLPPGGLRGSPTSFNIGDFDLYTNTELSDHWSMLGEMLVSSDFSNEFDVEMDRLLLTYRKNDYLRISIGKFATALGYYAAQFHRAQYFQTAIGRPIMFSDEDNGGILPTHNIGITASGLVPSGKLGLHWVAEVANGRSSTNLDVPVQNFVDENNGKAVNFGAFVRPEQLNGFEAGFSLYHDTLHPPSAPQIGQLIFAGHVVYVGSRLEWLNEAALLRHSLQGLDQSFHPFTSYTQLAWSFGKTKPYFRYDYQNIAAADPVFGFLGRRNGPSIGINRRFSNYVVGKLQYGRLGERQANSINDVTAQLAFAF